jgi:hypothetical protein
MRFPLIWDHPPMTDAQKPAGAGPTRAEDSAHDVLAAEEFGVPARDPSLNHGPVGLPSDPTGIVEPHDVLAAEEFAMPAPRQRAGMVATAGSSARRPGALARAVGAAVTVLVVARMLRRGRH